MERASDCPLQTTPIGDGGIIETAATSTYCNSGINTSGIYLCTNVIFLVLALVMTYNQPSGTTSKTTTKERNRYKDS